MFPTPPRHTMDASPEIWYQASYTGLPVSRSTSPQSSNGSLVCTPYQSGGDISSSGNSFCYAACDACPVGSDKQVVGLGLNIPGPSTSSLLRPSSEVVPEMLNGFGAVPFSVDYVQGPQNNDVGWRGADPGFSGLVDPRYGVYTPTPHPHATSRARSASTRGAGASISPLLCLEGLSLGENRSGNVRSAARSISHPPGNYTHSSQEIFGADPYSYTMADFSSRGSQWTSLAEDFKPVSPIPRNENGKTPLFQSRVGSDRTRAISSSRRSNLDKKLLHCDVPGCGATLTSRHNFKSHKNSHYGIKPHPCGQGQCNKRFGTTAEVKRHRAKHCHYKES